LHIFLLQASKKVKEKAIKRTVKLEAVQVEEIPQTQQSRSAPAPSRPSVPIASEDEDLPEDETIDFTDLDLESEPPPPPPPPDQIDDSVPVFVPHDEPPQPIGGYQAIQRKLVYPEIARKAGVEGRVMIWAQIGEDGSVVRTRVMKSLGPNGCDEAAMKAIRDVKWKPAMQRDKPVRVWVAVPVDFRLK
jgi:protein TonB